MRLNAGLVGLAAALVLAVPSWVGRAGAGSAGRDCQEAGSDQGVVQGRLGLLEGMGPAAFIVTVEGPLCLKGPAIHDTVAQVASVQLYSASAEGFQDLYRLVGEKIYVRGKLSAGNTFQQRAPVLMEVIEIATR